MTVIRNTVAMIAVLAMTACSNAQTQSEPSAEGAFLRSMAGLIFRNDDAAAPAPEINRTQFEGFTDPLVLVTLEDVQVQAVIARVGRNGRAETYQGADGISLTVIDGVMAATRGYSDDLMHSDQTGVRAALQAGQGSYTRTMSYLTGQDGFLTLVFRCELRAAGREGITILGTNHQTRRFDETCTQDDRRIDNTYWMTGGQMMKSSQWVGDGISRMTLEQIQ